MAPIGKLNTPLVNFRGYKARIVSKYLNQELEVTPDFVIGKDTQTAEYQAKFPLGKSPTYEGADGFCLSDSSAIAYYLASKASDSPLLGKTAEETAEILQYILFAESDLTPAVINVLIPALMPEVPYIKPAVQAAEKQMARFLAALNTILIDKTFLVGERITVADIVVACDLVMTYKLYLEAADRKQYRNLTRYFKTMVAQPEFKAIIGDVKLCEKRIQPAAPAKKEKEKKKAEQPKKAEKKAEKPEVEEEKPAPKPKSKLDSLPPTSMPLDEWKRFYSNNDTKPDAMEWLWKNYDAEGYSFWKVEYKYNDELTQLFMTNNLIGGFFSRLERARKCAFGCLLTLGVANDNMIWGYFIVRGKEIPEEVTDAADFESFQWTAADHTDPKTRAEIEDCFAWEGPALPRECYDGKVFK
ncbi:hypothetical protein LPJ78_000057 [Coemansia sp. RSA 989]|nr:hypothetical protein BX667DRAFT_496888 [Coemansia mojavensis]KAJ1744403.1 hypothetical protein LPJ68_000083 [Coemansia sp. RSA 1086]KAJ1753634.1 hypothetical protein LPJ79_000227 [Coemansia sp. RSA 1821]KAJ1868545.1 hypothetical protein LPJ78_000057 [Coemansia sp. RSA 989]KAJ2633996.1 hypothetical protein H4R22_000084 [Coemansia sp. RSA 1290]KAJ2652333.1 hypothetical protein IWW40_001188 [Coemansia sp. RSA 1250]KAJ2675861.1 hypothetical protein IWW42_000906 [Coemansia sp. RSA 1085]